MTHTTPVYVITGASDGIGAELTRQLSQKFQNKINFVLVGRDIEKLEAIASFCKNLQSEVIAISANLSQQNECKRIIAEAINHFGRIDVLINNAGVSAHALFEDVQDLGWYEDLMKINFFNPVWCTHAALPYLKQSNGQIVTVSSQLGCIPMEGRNAYCATKAAVNNFFDSLRIELKDKNIQVTLVYPGVVDTNTRRNGYNADGKKAQKSGLKEDKAMPVDICAKIMIIGILKKEREIMLTKQGTLARYMRLIAPTFLEYLSSKLLNRR